jgi:T-complex protein 1 subunit delta
MAGAFLRAAQELLAKGMHPTQVSDGFQVAMNKSVAVIESMATPVDLNNRDQLI